MFFAAYNICIAQQTKFDSLKRLLPKTTIPEKRVALLIDIAKSIYYSVPDSSIGYCEEAEEFSKKNNLDIPLAYSLHCECRYLLLKGDIKTTIEKLNKAIAIFEKEKELKGLAKAYSLKSVALGRLAKKAEELDYLLKAKDIYISLNDKDGLSNVFPNLANIYNDIGQYQNALNALAENQKLNSPKSSNEFYIEINYGLIYYNQNKVLEALKHYEKAVYVAHEYKMLDSEITGITHIAECYQKLNNLEKAQIYYQSALTLATDNHLLVEEKDALKGIVDLYEDQKNYNLKGGLVIKVFRLTEICLFMEENKNLSNN